jgi:hypothetical protein
VSLIDPDLLVEKARQFARSDDFLGEAWQTPMRVLLSSIEAESALHPSRTERLMAEMLALLVTRSRMAALLQRRPEIAEIDLGSPLVITGLPRTGTTLLHNMMARCPGNRSYRLWELRTPALCPDPARELEASAEMLRWLYQRAPALRDIHLMSPETPDECNWLLRPTFTTPVFAWTNFAPSYEAWLYQHDARGAYAEWKLQLQMLRWRSPGGRLVLKDPGHLWNLTALLDTLPNAQVIVMEREMEQAVASFCSLCVTLQGMDSDMQDLHAIGRATLDRVRLGRARLADAMSRRPDRFRVVSYRALVADPVATVGELQAWAQRPFDRRAQAACREFLARQVRGTPHRYDLARFGLQSAVL